MPHTEEPFYKMKIGWAADPKVEALGRFGPVDACLGRDLFSQMIDYARGQLTDGLVPASAIGRVAHPLPADDADRIVRQLADPGPYGSLCEWDTTRNAWRIPAYGRWNDTKAEVLGRREVARAAALHRWKNADATRNATRNAGGNALGNAIRIGDATRIADGDATRNAEVEVETESSGSRRHAGAGAHAREATPDDDDDELTQVQALMAAAGRPVSRQDAAAIRTTVLAKGGNVRNRRAFIGRVLGDPKQARAYAPGAGHVDTAREIIDRARRPGGPAADPGARAAEARAQLATRDRPLAAEVPEPPALHGEALARAQLAAARASRLPDLPEPIIGPENDDDDQTDPEEADAEETDADVPF
jgi:hypothetical protein